MSESNSTASGVYMIRCAMEKCTSGVPLTSPSDGVFTAGLSQTVSTTRAISNVLGTNTGQMRSNGLSLRPSRSMV